MQENEFTENGGVDSVFKIGFHDGFLLPVIELWVS
jgi:hypothetical protein